MPDLAGAAPGPNAIHRTLIDLGGFFHADQQVIDEVCQPVAFGLLVGRIEACEHRLLVARFGGLDGLPVSLAGFRVCGLVRAITSASDQQ